MSAIDKSIAEARGLVPLIGDDKASVWLWARHTDVFKNQQHAMDALKKGIVAPVVDSQIIPATETDSELLLELVHIVDELDNVLHDIARLISRIKRRTKRPRAIDDLSLSLDAIGVDEMIANLKWTPPTTRVDGSALDPSEIASVDVTDSFDGSVENIPGNANSFATGTLAVGQHNFTVVTNDTTGHSSAPSNAASVTVAPTLAAPSAVTDLAATTA